MIDPVLIGLFIELSIKIIDLVRDYTKNTENNREIPKESKHSHVKDLVLNSVTHEIKSKFPESTHGQIMESLSEPIDGVIHAQVSSYHDDGTFVRGDV